ncbi:hypothetical protein [Candidatus Nitrospira bockiana]
MTGSRPSHLTRGLAAAALVGALGLWSPTGAAEFHFVVQDIEDKRAVWVPQDVVIHRSTEMQDGVAFVLENPTDRTHAFAAYGLFEEVMTAGGEVTRKPLRVNVTPEDVVRVQISTAQFEAIAGVLIGTQGFPFFCPLHKGDAHLGGTIYVVP